MDRKKIFFSVKIPITFTKKEEKDSKISQKMKN
jgi:hypothetical protein